MDGSSTASPQRTPKPRPHRCSVPSSPGGHSRGPSSAALPIPIPHPTKTRCLDRRESGIICSHQPRSARGIQGASRPALAGNPTAPSFCSRSARGQKEREFLGWSRLTRQRQGAGSPSQVELPTPKSSRNPGRFGFLRCRGAPASLRALPVTSLSPRPCHPWDEASPARHGPTAAGNSKDPDPQEWPRQPPGSAGGTEQQLPPGAAG